MNPNMGNHSVGNEGSSGPSSHHHQQQQQQQQQQDSINSTLAMVTMPNVTMYSNYTAPPSRDVYTDYNMYHKQQYVHQLQKENGGMYHDVPNSMYDLTSPHHLSSDPTHSPPSPPPPPRVYRPCVVCLDKSSGYHYGVSSCEGCKGFFRRSVQKNMQYTCHKDKNCPINKVTRNRCQYCRLQKCFSAGMSREAVRNDRNKKRKKTAESSSSSSSSTTSTTSDELTEDENLLLQDVLEAHRLTCDTAPISDNGVIENGDKDKDQSPEENGKDKENAAEKNGNKLWDKISLLSSGGIVKIVDFAKKISGFSSLCTSDQITLLKAACLEIMILRLSFRYDPDLDSMVFSNKVCINREQLEEGGFGVLAATIFNFAASLKSMSTDETEFAVLSAVCLVSGDRSGLKESVKIEQLQEPLLEALKHYVRSRREEQPHVFAKMLMKLTDLRSISVKGEMDSMTFAVDFMNKILVPVEKIIEDEPLGIYRYNGIRIIKSTSVDSPLPSQIKKDKDNVGYTPNNVKGYYETYNPQYSSNTNLGSNSPMEIGSGISMNQSPSLSPMEYMSGPSPVSQYSAVYQHGHVSTTTTANGQPLTPSYPGTSQDINGGAQTPSTSGEQSSTLKSQSKENVQGTSEDYGAVQCEVKIENVNVPATLFDNAYTNQTFQQQNTQNFNQNSQGFHQNGQAIKTEFDPSQQGYQQCQGQYEVQNGSNGNYDKDVPIGYYPYDFSGFEPGVFQDQHSMPVSRLVSHVLESSEPVSQFGGIISEALSDILQL